MGFKTLRFEFSVFDLLKAITGFHMKIFGFVFKIIAAVMSVIAKPIFKLLKDAIMAIIPKDLSNLVNLPQLPEMPFDAVEVVNMIMDVAVFDFTSSLFIPLHVGRGYLDESQGCHPMAGRNFTQALIPDGDYMGWTGMETNFDPASKAFTFCADSHATRGNVIIGYCIGACSSLSITTPQGPATSNSFRRLSPSPRC